MWLKRLFCVLLACFCLQAVVAQEELTDKYLSIRDKLISLKANCEIVTEQLIQVSENLKLSQKEAEEWKQTSTTLSENLMSINEQLNDSYETITKLQVKIQQKNKILTWLIVILAIRIMGMIAGYIIYAKGVKLPRWLDILL